MFLFEVGLKSVLVGQTRVELKRMRVRNENDSRV